MPARFDTMNTPLARDAVVGNGMPYITADDIVISGFSGRLPESSTIDEFKQQLFEGVDLVTDDDRRWPSGMFGLPGRMGKLKDLTSFDASFFGVHAKQANVMDPQQRMLLELTYEAIVDSGINPADIRGSKTGVFIGVSQTESEEYWTTNSDIKNGYGLTGCCRAMFPNRISYAFNFVGPSFAIDTACSSSMYAIHQAIMAMRSGQCDAAIVGGVNILLKPTSSLQFLRMNMLSPAGACKAFDTSGDGYVRSEAAVVIFMQRSKDARRTYATIVNSRVNMDGYKDQGITYPNGIMQNKLMREVYTEAGINPADVVYVEAHGTGTKVGDPQEVNSIAELFCKDRRSPLLMGSVKSNMGHSEPASGLCSLAKVLIAMEQGVIPPNLHFSQPNTDIPALNDGRIKVIAEPTPWKGGLVGINSFGFGGANAHLVLRSNPKPKISPMMNVGVPKIVAVSGRTEEAVNSLLDEVKENEKDDEFISLIQNIHANNIPGHPYRGYQILGEAEEREVDIHSGDHRPIWYIFSGMGSQWSGMGKALLPIPTFSDSLRRCAEALKPCDVDLMELILNGTDETFEDVLNSFVAIAAIQVALVDVLTMLGIHPDGIIGHSVGEVGCAYADGTFTAEQTVLAAYWRGKSIKESELPENMGMAAVGLSWAETKKRCPSDIFPACHNSSDSVTISGPCDSLEAFSAELKAEGIFVKMVKSSGVAFHSKYISAAGSKLRASLEKIIVNPKQRSSRWISTSIPESAWGTPLAQLSSPAYHVNNLLSPVLFQEALKHVPENAIVVEIAPHCLLQAILRRSLPATVTKVGLHKKDQTNNMVFLLTNVGKLYNVGVQPQLSKLYPSISFPVGRGTPMINSMIKWDHSIQWDVADFSGKSSRSGESIVEVDLANEEYSYLAGHAIDGRVLFPATAYLTLVWKTFAKFQGVEFEKLPIVLEDVKFHRATILPKEGRVRFLVNILDGTGNFEICEGSSVTVTGKIRTPENVELEQLKLPIPSKGKEAKLLRLKIEDVYKDLRLRGYDYSGYFQGIVNADNRGFTGNLTWSEDWIAFMDTMLQFSILSKDTRDLYLPTRLQRAIIDPVGHKGFVKNIKMNEGVPVYNYPHIGLIRSGGIEIKGMKASLSPKRQLTQPPPKHERYVFVPNENSQVLVEDPTKCKFHALTVLLQLAKENLGNHKYKMVEVTGERSSEALMTLVIYEIMALEPMVILDLQLATSSPDSHAAFMDRWNLQAVVKDGNSTPVGQDLHIVLAADVLTNKQTTLLKNLAKSIKSGGFVILEETGSADPDIVKEAGLVQVAKQIVPGRSYVLLKKLEEIPEPIVLEITEKNFEWLEGLKLLMKKAENENQKILLVSEGEELLGMVGLSMCIREEPGGQNVRYVFIQDKNAPKFSLTNKFYSEQLDKQLLSNVLKGNQWGSYRHLRLDQQTDVSSLHVEHAYINTLVRGDLTSLRWIEGPLSYYQPEIYPGKELCSVYYAPLNFRDIMLATGQLNADALPGDLASQDCILGLEFSGRNSKGERVMGMVAAQGLATTVLADPGFMWKVPNEWTLEQAATIPVVYSTSYYALFIRGGIKPGNSVLIHAGSGGVGQASIAIALGMGCKVFTTVGSEEKKKFLLKTFPQLSETNIGNSRDTSFEQMVLFETEGRGVDIVLNSLSGEKLQASIRCLANGGRFLEIGKFDLSNNTPLGMSLFLKNTTFHGILLDALFDKDSQEKRDLVKMVADGIKNGTVKPLPTTVFNENQIEQGFRFMATGKHIGKVLLKIRDEEPKKISSPNPKTVASIPRVYMNPEKCYVLVGGLGGFGLELTNWLVARGAKHIVLASRSGVRTGYQELCIRRWREAGINIQISTENITTLAGTDKLLNASNKLAPVGGIFNLAAVLRDALLENLEEGHFKAVSSPKVDGTKNLDLSSRKLCPALDYFIVFSSVTSGRGNMGQTNYGLANSAMERICEHRQANGLPGLAIQWGAIGDVGLIMENMGNNETEIRGTVPQRMSSCLMTLDTFLQQPHPVLSSMVLADKNKSDDGQNQVDLLQAVGNILGIKDLKTVNMNNSLADLGMDSLMGTEIKQTLERNYDIVLSPQEIRGLTFGKLKTFMSDGSETTDAVTAPTTATTTATTTTTTTAMTASLENGPAELLFQCVGTEIVPKKTLVQLESRDTKGAPIFVVSAIEGAIASLKGLASELERPVFGLQCTKDTPLESIASFAEFYVKRMKEVQKVGPYTIIGYSFGALVAFEMALQLEILGESVEIMLIDGSPEFVTLHCKTIGKQTGQITESLEDDGTRKALAYFARQLNSNIGFLKAYNVLRETKTDEEMFNKMLDMIGSTPFTAEDIKVAGILFFKKLKAAVFYKPTGKYEGPVTLIKAKDSFVSLNTDYGLSQICRQNIRIEELLGNHRSILSGDNVKKIAELLRI